MHAKTTRKVKIMEIFKLTLSQMLMMFTLIAAGVLLRKAAVLNTHAGNIMARLETYVFVPALLLYTQMTKCTVATFVENTDIILYGSLRCSCRRRTALPSATTSATSIVTR